MLVTMIAARDIKGLGNLSTQARSTTNNTRGKFLIFNDMVCDTRYSKSCGGVSEHNENVWDMEPKPYLRGVFDSEQKGLPRPFRSNSF